MLTVHSKTKNIMWHRGQAEWLFNISKFLIIWDVKFEIRVQISVGLEIIPDTT